MNDASSNKSNVEYELNQNVYEKTMQDLKKIVDHIMALQNKTLTYKEEAHLSDLAINFNKLIMNIQDNVDLNLNHKDLRDFFINALQHYLEIFNIQLDNPEQAFQLIRYQ